MAATALGYLTWGIEENPSNYGLGDLGDGRSTSYKSGALTKMKPKMKT